VAAGEARAVLVTGGSRGIGRAIARAFAERGDRVAVHHGSSREQAEEVVAGLPGNGHALVQADMGDPDAVARRSTPPPRPSAGSTSS
jgi:NAD(P)-dependent dehydrogenase (short-subunit alcohol dehydrogenase family)